MIRVIHAASWFSRRHFYLFSHDLYRNDSMWREPEIWKGNAVLSSRTNELLRNKHTLLVAVENGRILARVLTGVRVAVGADEEPEGFFTMFDAVPRKDAVQALVDEMKAWQHRQGTKCIIGPIAPIPADLGSGVLVAGFETAVFNDCFNAPYYDEYLTACGFETESEWLAYRVNIMEQFDREKYRRTAEMLSRRFECRIDEHIIKRPRLYTSAVCEVMGLSEAKEHMNRVMSWIMPFVEPRLCPMVFDKDNKPIGFLLTIRKHPQPPRIVTLWVHEKWRRKGITALLFDHAARAAQSLNIDQIDASQIRADNMASKLGVENVGGKVMRCCRQYKLHI